MDAGNLARVDNPAGYNFLVRPTCPPSIGFHVTGGRIAMPPSWDACTFFVNAGTIDLQTHEESYWDYVFTNANWYLPLYVTVAWYYVGWGPSYIDMADAIRFHGAEPGPGFGYLGGGFVEFATAIEAEGAIDEQNSDYSKQDYICETGEPIARLILRNNGNTMQPNQFMIVDGTNRGRSYIWGRYCNQRMMW